MINRKFAVLCALAVMLCFTLLAGCSKETPPEEKPEEIITETANFLSGEEFMEIMEKNGAYVYDMSEYGLLGYFIATDADESILEVDYGDYMYTIVFLSSEDKSEIDRDYISLINRFENEFKTFEETYGDGEFKRYEFISERYGYNVIISAGNVLVWGDGPEESRDLIDSFVEMLGF
jgi:hypothetical protein